jgi:hypothetical protein
VHIKIYKIVILPVVLYRRETLSLALREERKLRVLRRIFGAKREEVAGGWRRLQNEGLQNSYSSPNTIKVTKSRRMRLAGHVTRIAEMTR